MHLTVSIPIAVLALSVAMAAAQDVHDAQYPLQNYTALFADCPADPDFQIDLGQPDTSGSVGKRRVYGGAARRAITGSHAELSNRATYAGLSDQYWDAYFDGNFGHYKGLLRTIPYTIEQCYKLAFVTWAVPLGIGRGQPNMANTRTFRVATGIPYYLAYNFNRDIDSVKVWVKSGDTFKLLWDLGVHLVSSGQAAGWFMSFAEAADAHVQFIYKQPESGQDIAEGWISMNDWAAGDALGPNTVAGLPGPPPP